jgi:putative MATE family efflux protein
MRGATAGRDLTRGPLLGGIVAIAWPLMLSSLLQTLYNLADAFWLGMLGKTALVAPTVTMNLVFLFMALGMGLGMGGTTLVSQYRGAGRPEDMRRAAGQTLLVLGGVSVFFAVVIVALSRPLLQLMQTPADAMDQTLGYFRWIMGGMPFMFGFFVYQSIYTGLGDTFRPLQVNFVTIIVNVLLDPILIFGLGPFPEMGVSGAAVATVASRAMASFLGLSRLRSGHGGLRIRRRDLLPHLPTIRKIARIGVPISLGQSGTALGFTVLISIVNTFGSAVVAAFGIGNRIVGMAVMPGHGLGQATGTAVGQNLGAGLRDRAERSVRISLFIIGALFLPATAAMFFYGAGISELFIDNPEVVAYGESLFRIISPSVFVFGFFMVLLGAFQGSGHTMPVMVLNMSRLWVLRIPAALLLARLLSMGPTGIWLAMFISNIVTSAAAFVWFSRGTWKRAVIDRGKPGGAWSRRMPGPGRGLTRR